MPRLLDERKRIAFHPIMLTSFEELASKETWSSPETTPSNAEENPLNILHFRIDASRGAGLEVLGWAEGLSPLEFGVGPADFVSYVTGPAAHGRLSTPEALSAHTMELIGALRTGTLVRSGPFRRVAERAVRHQQEANRQRDADAWADRLANDVADAKD